MTTSSPLPPSAPSPFSSPPLPPTAPLPTAPPVSTTEPISYPPLQPALTTVASTLLPLSAADDARLTGVTVLVISGQRKTFRFEGEMTVFRVKEYIFHMWPVEWTTEPTKPPSPAYFRILYRGRMLDDESTLTSNGILPLTGNRTTIVHLSVRTFPIAAADDTKLDDAPRPPLHTRASSRIQRAVGLGGGNNTNNNGNNNTSVADSNPRRATANEAGRRAGGGGEDHGGGCGCVIS